jgi:hypothetical protein
MLNNNGVLQWNTFMGPSSSMSNWGGIAVGSSENVFVTESSDINWGKPINPHQGGNDVMVAKIAPSPLQNDGDNSGGGGGGGCFINTLRF